MREAVELAITTDEGNGETADSARAHERQGANDGTGDDALGLAFRLQRDRLVELEGTSGRGHRALAGEDRAGLSCLLEASCDVHGVAARERAAFARRSDDDVAGVEADPQRKSAFEELSQPALHGECSVQRALGVVFQRSRRAERRHNRVAGELLDRPARALDLLGHCVVEAVEDRPRLLRILGVGERG